MIHTDKEYKEVLTNVIKIESENYFEKRKKELIKKGYTEQVAEEMIQPSRLLYEQAKYDLQEYEKNSVDSYISLPHIGEMKGDE